MIYPDLIFSIEKNGKTTQLVALETKGKFLDGTEHTNYKRALMQLLTEKFSWESTSSVGELQLEQDGVMVSCDIVLLDEWREKLPANYFNREPVLVSPTLF